MVQNLNTFQDNVQNITSLLTTNLTTSYTCQDPDYTHINITGTINNITDQDLETYYEYEITSRVEDNDKSATIIIDLGKIHYYTTIFLKTYSFSYQETTGKLYYSTDGTNYSLIYETQHGVVSTYAINTLAIRYLKYYVSSYSDSMWNDIRLRIYEIGATGTLL